MEYEVPAPENGDGEAALLERVNSMYKLLKQSTEEVIVLRSAVSHLHTRLENLERRGPRASAPARPSMSPAAPASKQPPAAQSRKPALPSTNAAKPRVPRAPSSSVSSKPRVPGSALKKGAGADEAEKEKEDLPIDPSRRSSYYVGARSLHVVASEKMMQQADPQPSMPPADLQLEFVYGFNGKAARQNLFYNRFSRNPQTSLIYSVAGTGIVCDVTNMTQKHFTEHDEDILCLAVHPSRPIVATGQLDPKGAGTPYICIWSSEDMSLVKKIVWHDRGVCALAFSPDGTYLASVGDDDSHTMALWNWEKHITSNKKPKKGEGCPLLETMTNKDKVFTVAWNPCPVTDDGEEIKSGDYYEIVTLGAKHIKIHSVQNLTKDPKERKITGRIPSTLQKTGVTQKAYHSVTFAKNGDSVVGTQSGAIYRFRSSKLVKAIDAHKSICGIVCATGDGFISLGDDGKLKVWDDNLQLRDEIDLVDPSDQASGNKLQVRSVDWIGPSPGKALLGTRINSIVELDLRTKRFKTLVEGHSSELWGLATHHHDHVVATGAHDKHLYVWDYESHCPVQDKSLWLKSNIRSCAFSSDGRLLAVGQIDGSVAVVDYESFTVVWEQKLAGEQCDCLSFSPDCSHLAVGSWDQALYIVTAGDGTVRKKFTGHTSSILMLSWSRDSRYIMTNSRDYEILYWDVHDMRRVISKAEVVDADWASWTCFLGWPVAGIWQDANDGTDINNVDRSKDETLLAAGDDFGKVRLFKWPANHKDAPRKEYSGHSSHVTNVRFSHDDAYLFSTGGADTGVFQWRVVRAE